MIPEQLALMVAVLETVAIADSDSTPAVDSRLAAVGNNYTFLGTGFDHIAVVGYFAGKGNCT